MLFRLKLWFLVIVLVLGNVRLYAEPADEPALLIGGGTLMSRAPYRWLDQCKDRLSGSTLRLLEKIFAQLDIDYQYTKPVEYRPAIYDDFHQQLLAGEIDARVIYSKDRSDPDVLYSQYPVSSIKLAAFYPASHKTIRRPEDLESLVGIVISPSLQQTPYSPVQNYMRERNRRFLMAKSQKAAAKMINDGEADYIFALKYSPILIIKNGYQYMDIDETAGQYHLVVRKDSAIAKRMPEIDQLLENAIETGLVDFLEREYLLMWTEESKKQCVASPMNEAM